MSEIKQSHIRAKTIKQILLYILEFITIVGGLTGLSVLFWNIDSGLDILERIILFYGFYQILTYVILSNLNDIKADEYLALKTNASLALKACEYNDDVWKDIVRNSIDKQLDKKVFNDLLVRKNYVILKQCIDENAIKNIDYMAIWAQHSADIEKLNWRLCFLSRIFK